MSILLNDNLDVAVTKPVDNRYGPWATTAAAIAGIPAHKRHLGLVVGVVTTGVLSEYWFKDSVLDGGLVLKTVAGGVTSVGGVSPDVGGNVAISSVQLSAWGGVVASSVGVANGVATLDGTGKLTSSQLPTLTTTQISNFNLHTVTTAQVVGLDARVDSRIAGSTLTTTQVSGLSAALAAKLDVSGSIATSQVTGLDARVDSRIAVGSITTAQVTGFDSRVDSRIAAGSMTTTQIAGLTTALSGKSNTGHSHTASEVTDFSSAADARIAAASGVSLCPLSSGLVPSSYLPSYVDDIIDSTTVAALPGTGEVGKIYVITTGADSGKIYRWSGSTYVLISPSPGTTDEVPEGSINRYHTVARVNALIAAANLTTSQITGFNAAASAAAPVQAVCGYTGHVWLGTVDISGLDTLGVSTTQISGLTKTAVGLGNVDNVADANKTFTTAQISGLTVVPLTSTQINGITGLTTTQISNFNAHTVTTAQVTGLLPMVTSQIAAAAIGTQQVTGLTSLALTSTQINGITGLTTTQISNFNAHTVTTAQVIGLTSFALSSTQVNALTLQTNQIAGLTSFALSSTQINALTGLTTTQITGWAATQNLKANAAAPALTGAGTFATLQGALLTAQQGALTSASIAALTVTGSGTAPTVAVDNNSTLIATTAFIQGQKATSNPLMNNAVAIGTSAKWSPQDHVHPVDTSRAPLASPTFTGKVTTAASTTSPGAGLNLPQGSAPTSPVDGDVWTTASGIFVRIAGATVGPLSTGGGGAATSLAAFATVTAVREVATVNATPLTGTLTLNATTQAVYWSNIAATGNFVVNLTTTATMNTTLAVGDSLTVQLIVNNGATAYYCTSVQVQGTVTDVTTNWLGGSAPTAGDPNSKNIYTFQIIKTAVNTYTVFASQTRFA